MSVTSLTVLSEFTSLSEPVTWEAGLCPGGLCPHTTVNNVTPLLAYHAYPDSDLSLIAADLGHRSVSDEVIRLLCCSCWWQNWTEIQRRHKKEVMLLFLQVHKVGLFSTWHRWLPDTLKVKLSSRVSNPLDTTLRSCFLVWIHAQDKIHQSKVYGTVKDELWKIFRLRCYFIIIVYLSGELINSG